MGVVVFMVACASCEECGEEAKTTYYWSSADDAEDELRQSGWKVDSHETLCPDCYVREDDDPDGGKR